MIKILLTSTCLLFSLSANAAEQDKKVFGYDEYAKQTELFAPAYKKSVIGSEGFLELTKNPKTTIIDLRNKVDYDAVHIKNAINLNASQITPENLEKYVSSKDQPIVIYCDDSLNSSRALSRAISITIICFPQLAALGYSNISVLDVTAGEGDFEGKWLKKLPFVYTSPAPENATEVSKRLIDILSDI